MTDVCTRAPVTTSGARSSDRADLLRKERFGGLYYHRDGCRYDELRPWQLSLLDGARVRSAVEVAASQRPPVSDLELAEQLATWRRDGVLDDDLRCRAVLVDDDRSHGALIGPMVTHVQLTQACNLRCTHCYVDVMAKRSPDELSLAQLDSLFRELRAMGSGILVLAGGEPMVRDDLDEILAAADQQELDTWLCSNGTRIFDEEAARFAASGLRGISISLDGADAETHDHLRGAGQFERTLRGVRALVRAGMPDVQLRVTVTPHNAERLLDFAPIAEELGVDQVVFKPYRQSGAASGNDALFLDRAAYFVALNHAIDHWPGDRVPASFGNGMPGRPSAWTGVIPRFGCVGGTTTATVTFDGRVVSCGSVLDKADWTLHERGFREAWRGSPTVTEWRSFAGNDECRSCDNYSTCGGGCRARALGQGKGINDSDPWARCSLHAKPRRALPVVA